MQWSDTTNNTGILQEIRRSLRQPATGGLWLDTDLLRRANIIMRSICEQSECLAILNLGLWKMVFYPRPQSFNAVSNIVFHPRKPNPSVLSSHCAYAKNTRMSFYFTLKNVFHRFSLFFKKTHRLRLPLNSGKRQAQ